MTILTPPDDDILTILNDPLTRWHQLTADLADLGAEQRTLVERLAILEGQLADETRGTVEQRKRAGERRETWKLRLGFIETEAHLLRLSLASWWHRLPAAEKDRLRAYPDFPAETVAPKIAQGVWEQVRSGERPGWMVPF